VPAGAAPQPNLLLILWRPQVMAAVVHKFAAGEKYIGQEMMIFMLKRKTSPDNEMLSELSSREAEVFHVSSIPEGTFDLSSSGYSVFLIGFVLSANRENPYMP